MLKRVDQCGSAGLIVYYLQDTELMTWHRWEIGNRVSKKFSPPLSRPHQLSLPFLSPYCRNLSHHHRANFGCIVSIVFSLSARSASLQIKCRHVDDEMFLC